MIYLLKTVRLHTSDSMPSNPARFLLSTILLWACFTPGSTWAQDDQIRRMDSVRQVLNALPTDTSKVNAHYRLGELFERSLPDSALVLYKRGYELSKMIGFRKGEAAYGSYAIEILNAQGKFREALDIAKAALAIYEQLDRPYDLGRALLNVGSEWQYLSDFQQASEYYLRALKIMDELGHRYSQRMIVNNLASIFINLGQYAKGKGYAERSLAIARDLGLDYPVSSSMFNVATAELYLKQYDKALAHYQEIEALGKKMNDYIVILDGWLGIADTYNGMNNTSAAFGWYRKVIALSAEKNAPEYEMYAYLGASDAYLKAGQLPEAREMVDKGIALAAEQGSLFELKDFYKRASELAEKGGELSRALELRKKFEILNDSVSGEKSRSHVEMLEARFESEKKASMITQLEAEKQVHQLEIREKTILNLLLAGAVGVVAIISFLVYRNSRQRRSLLDQQIERLNQEKQLMATEAVLKGEEKERARLARDLHDGLGGMLSGLKHNLSYMKGNQIMTSENQVAFERSLDMLDKSIKEMRRVAHNMMPEALLRFGLDAALRDFCTDITLSGALEVNYQSFGIENVHIEQTQSIGIYRIVQELITNAIKHADAKNGIVQLSNDNGRIALTVEDNGKGFDTSASNAGQGIGWSNIRSRVDFLKGKLDVHSDGRGTSVHIEF